MIWSTAGGTGIVNKLLTPFGQYSKNGRGCQRKTTAEVQNMSKEDMIAEIQRVLEDANEWEVRDVYEYVMDEVG
jgi:hypothetical protein